MYARPGNISDPGREPGRGSADVRVEASHTLAGVTLFEGLDEDERRRLESRCTWRRYSPGELVLERGSESREVLFIVTGSVDILNFSLTGREVAFARLLAGDCFGELAAIDGQPRSASVVAAEKTLVAVLPSEQFIELLRMARPDVAVPNLWVIHPLPPLREIASRISTTRETVARALSQLYPTGLARRKGKSLYIPDRDKFEETLTALQREGGGHLHI